MSKDDHFGFGGDQDSDVVFKEDINLKEPKQYKVLLHNDDYTPMNFVTEILVKIFYKEIREATRIMFRVHREGVASCGVYSMEVAETKVNRVHRTAAEFGYPLKSSMEEA